MIQLGSAPTRQTTSSSKWLRKPSQSCRRLTVTCRMASSWSVPTITIDTKPLEFPNSADGRGLMPQLTTLGLTHSVVCYVSEPSKALANFSGPKRPPPNGLAARLYGMKNVYTALIRTYAAYHIANRELYDLAMWTLLGVLFLNVTELVAYRTARLKEAVFPLMTSGGLLLWMYLQRDWYTQ